MLNRTQLIQACESYITEHVSTIQKERFRGQRIWSCLIQDKTLLDRLKESINEQTSLPSLTELSANAVFSAPQSYTAYALDGSQIYPDRHRDISCYLINIGKVALRYGKESGAWFDTCLSLHSDALHIVGQELVNAHRTAFEFEYAIDWCSKNRSGNNILCVDGSLIFWHLSSHETSIAQKYLNRYLSALTILYEQKMPVIGYISLPKSKELVFLVREVQKLLPQEYQGSLDYLVDSDLIGNWLKPYHRTNVFKHNSELMQEYPDFLRVYFFYVHVGDEIARIELPEWLVGQVDDIASLIVDQANKGRGYPVCLAEAHEQAVVSFIDQEFFYHIIRQKAGCYQNIFMSQKLLKKRLLDI